MRAPSCRSVMVGYAAPVASISAEPDEIERVIGQERWANDLIVAHSDHRRGPQAFVPRTCARGRAEQSVLR